MVALSDSSGSIVEQYSYDVFGEMTIYDANDQILNTSDYNNPYMFTGRRLDEETDNYYYRARYYEPKIGRFLRPGGLSLRKISIAKLANIVKMMDYFRF